MTTVRRRTAWERGHRPRLESVTAALLASSRGPDLAQLEGHLRERAADLRGSPYWVRRLRDAGLAPGDLQTFADLDAFPLLDRRELAVAWAELPLLGVDDVVVVKSSGSTGDPVHVVREPFEQIHMWAVLEFWLAHLGLVLPARPRVVLLDSLPSALEYSVRVRALGDGQGALHRISLARPRARERLERVSPSVVFGDPAGLHWWIGAAPQISPRLVLTSATHFSAAQRAAFAQVSPAPVLNYYATTETGPLAWECLVAPGRFHILTPDVWLESVAGELVVTRLRPTLVPLLRYRTGDAGTVVDEPRCACGHSGWTLLGLDGRRACTFVRPDGTPVDAWQLAWVFKQVPLDRFRLEQVARDRFLLHAAPTDEVRLETILREALFRLGWPTCEIARTGPPPLGDKPEPFR